MKNAYKKWKCLKGLQFVFLCFFLSILLYYFKNNKRTIPCKISFI